MEENLYAQLSQAEVRKKEAEEKRIRETKKKEEQDRLKILEWQNQQNSTKRDTEDRMMKQEKNMLNEQWQIEDEAEKQRQTQQFLINKERNLELIRHNALEKQILEEQENQEKLRDRQMVEQAQAREDSLNNLEQQEKDLRRNEAKELVAVYAASKADKDAEEKLLDKLTQLEEEKQWKQKEAKWRQEEEAKLQLMREVYESRATHIEHQKRLGIEKKDGVVRDANDIRNQVEEQQRAYEESKIAGEIARKTQQGDVLMQIGEKERYRKKEYQETMYEQRAMKLAELAYKKKIDDERTANEQILTQLREQRPF